MATLTNTTIPTNNALLQRLSEGDRARLAPDLARVSMAMRQPIEVANQSIDEVYFPERGIVSVVAKAPDGRQIEAGVIGREGMTGIAVVMGNHRSPNDAFIQVPGEAQRISADALRAALAYSPEMRAIFKRFVQVFMAQIAHTALANGRAKIEERLARWLLMAQDRLNGASIELTHELIALMLGVRRPGVTDALNALEGRGLIRSTRGAIRVIDRDGLIAGANGYYGVPEAEYERLLGPLRNS
jgi:CRP-like cAMP-binding protein